MIKDLKIGKRTVGLNKDIFISAEVGTTCNGDVETAKKLIDAAKETGMDAVKFQILNPDDKYSDKTLDFTYTRYSGEVVTENIYEMLQQYVLTFEQWSEIKKYADEKEIIMFATPDYLGGVDIMEKLNMPAYKIATWDVAFYPLVKKIAKLHKPTILDFGASDIEEVSRVIKVFEEEDNDQIILLHCFHTQNYEEMNLKTIEYYRKTFNCLSGFSAPDANNDIDFLSLAYDSVYIEKRLTLDRKDPNHHHSQALEPKEMKSYVKRIHELSAARGYFTLKPTQNDLEEKQKHFRRIVARREIKKGEELTEENIACRRPYYGGLDTKYFYTILGRRAQKDLKINEPITWDNI